MSQPRPSKSIPLRTSSFAPGDLAGGRVSNGAKNAVINNPLQKGSGKSKSGPATVQKIEFLNAPIFSRVSSS